MATGWSQPDSALQALQRKALPHWDSYLGFYSSWLDGYFREPWALLMPVDDHGFHRGDGVFEAIRLHEGAYFDLSSHLARLKDSAGKLGMGLPKTVSEIQAICVELARLCATPNGILRLYVTRGPGGFSPSPKEVIGQQIYAIITKMRPPSSELYSQGCRAMVSTVLAKEPFWSQIKSCNYLQNVMMKKECLERGVDFAICLDGQGRLCEGSTENMLLLNRERELLIPKFDYTLRGTTVRVVMSLAEDMVKAGKLRAVRFADLQRADLLAAAEAAFVGTTLGVLPMREVDGHKIDVGPVCAALNQALMAAMSSRADLRTKY